LACRVFPWESTITTAKRSVLSNPGSRLFTARSYCCGGRRTRAPSISFARAMQVSVHGLVERASSWPGHAHD
jgi:hypothetical protein